MHVDCLFGLCTRLRVSVTALNGCHFEIDGSGVAGSECDESCTQWKQGRGVTSNCAEWMFDPDILY